MPSPRRILLLLASMVGAALVGWVAAASMAPETRARSTRQAEDLQVLQLLVLLDQEQGRQRQVTAELTARFKGLEPGQRLEIGLLLADLLRQSGSDQTAMRLYGQLATENKTVAKPLLA
jgi:lipopolysaccharide biosynthesis regulator YciM